MKIVVDARTLGSRPSGVGMYLNDFLKVLTKYEELEFILLSDVAESEYIKYYMNKGIKVCTYGKAIYRSANVYKYFEFVKKSLQELKPDIFWEVNTIIPIRLKGDFKTMITIHDMFPIEYVEYFGRVYSFYFKHNLAKTLKHTDMILYNSNQTKITTEKIFPKAASIKNCNAYIISNPIKQKYEIKDDGYFLYVGNMEKRKGVDLLIEGYKKYRQSGGTKNIIIAGKMQEDDIQSLLNDAIETTEGITYLNYVSHEKKMELYAGCSCFLFPSKAEGFGMPIIEVMKFYKPIIVGDLDIYKEIVGDIINDFNLNCDKQQQIDNLADMMLNYDDKVDKNEYDEVVRRYQPDKLGKIVRGFLNQE